MQNAKQNQSTPNIPQNRSTFPLTLPAHSPYPEYSKNTWDCHPSNGGHNRPLAGGIFSPVYYERGLFMPSSRSIQDGESRNTRVVSVRTMTGLGDFCQLSKLTNGALTMCKQISNAGELRPSDLIGNPADPITFQEIHNGKLALRGDKVVAWIHPGKHTGQADKKPLHCEFVDVAFYCQNSRGVYMDTEWFDTVDEAVAFIDRTFGQEAAQ